MNSAAENKLRCFDPEDIFRHITVYGFCSIIDLMQFWCKDNDVEWCNPYESMVWVAPELYRKKPLFIDDKSLESGYWFRNTPAGWEAREKLVDEVIAEIKQEIADELAKNPSTENN